MLTNDDSNQIDSNALVGDFSPRPLHERMTDGKLTPAQAEAMGTGDDFPHGHPELDAIDKADEEMNDAIVSPVTQENDLDAMNTVGQFLFGDDKVIDRDREPELPPSDPWAPQDQDEVQASGETPLLSAGEAKHAKRLAELERGVLEAIWAEYKFETDPRFAVMHEVTAKDPDELSDDEAREALNKLTAGGPALVIEYMTQVMALPAARRDAVRRYTEYRQMIEDFS